MPRRKEEGEVVQSEVLAMRYPSKLLGQLRELAAQEGVTLNEYVREVLRDHVKGVEWERKRVLYAKLEESQEKRGEA